MEGKETENQKIEQKRENREEIENRENRTEQKTTEQHQNLTIRSGTTYNNK